MAWLRIAGVLFIGGALVVVAFFLTGLLLVVGLVVAAVFSAWATIRLRSTTIKAHYETVHFDTEPERLVLTAEQVIVEDVEEPKKRGWGAKKSSKKDRKSKKPKK